MQLHPPMTAGPAPANASAEPEPLAPTPTSRLSRRLLWAGGITVLLLLLIFTPPLISVNRYRRGIARSMSESLGRPVHLDNVSLHLLPLPGLTLTNLVVSEDPAFGAEPTIRANTVEASLRLNSLWRRRVEFSTVRFVEPSVNLVRNAEGHWNLANVLLHASRVDTAPTAQAKPGPAPRFPYIEATGGRVNIKLAQEKLPFSLTNADFALWLPSANLWRVRLRGQPQRTDLNLTDPGVLRIEGDLRRSGALSQVPVDLRASWHDAPLGEASRLLTGDDMGWRGTLNVDASLAGTLNAAKLETQITLGGLRRADFAPTVPLDLQVSCGSGLAIDEITLSQLRCTLPVGAPQPMELLASSIQLQHPDEAQATLTAQGISLRWVLGWAALFSPRVPSDLHPTGTVDLSFTRAGAFLGAREVLPVRGSRTRRRHPRPLVAGDGSPWKGWTGTLTVHLPPAPGTTGSGTLATGTTPPIDLLWRLDATATPAQPGAADSTPSFRLQPVSLRLGADAALTLSGAIGSTGYTLSATGTASPAALLLPARYLPQLGDGLEAVLPFPPTGLQTSRVEFTCVRSWSTAQTCNGPRAAASPSRSVAALPAAFPPGTLIPQRNPPVLLAPRSLSPFDRDPRLGGVPPPSPQPNSPRL